MMKSEIEHSFLTSLDNKFGRKTINEDSYKLMKTIQERKDESSRVIAKYMDRIPVIVEKISRNDLGIDKKKFLVPSDFTIGQFIYVIRQRMKLSPEKGMFMFVKNTLPHVSMSIDEVYKSYHDEDGFLYFNYSTEEAVFG